MALHIATPLLPSNAFATRPGQQVWLKMQAWEAQLNVQSANRMSETRS
jgi:hypothetical protein